ncbi:MAG: hypothetical protein HQM10_20840 [Candidatus Riflebacteria bacterium]|nr:hypothetical protein [Candidatus Riflebacteria bacterium]
MNIKITGSVVLFGIMLSSAIWAEETINKAALEKAMKKYAVENALILIKDSKGNLSMKDRQGKEVKLPAEIEKACLSSQQDGQVKTAKDPVKLVIGVSEKGKAAIRNISAKK